MSIESERTPLLLKPGEEPAKTRAGGKRGEPGTLRGVKTWGGKISHIKVSTVGS